MDVRLAPNLKVGYVMGTGDEVPAALRGLGATVQLLDGDELAWGDLSRYDAIFIGVRAYDSREDLRANNKRILDYAPPAAPWSCSTTADNTWTQYAPFPARLQQHARDRRERRGTGSRVGRSGLPLTQRDRRQRVAELGAGARHLLHRPGRSAVHGSHPDSRAVRAQHRDGRRAPL